MSVNYIKPPKVLKTYVSQFDIDTSFVEGGNDDVYNGYPNRWAVTMHVESQEHGDPVTPTPYYYDGNDVKVGDWFSASVGGLAVKIVSISSQSSDTVVAIVEDVERYNLLVEASSVSSFGSGSSGGGVIFELGDDGLPVLSPLPDSYLLTTFATDMMSRFRYRNLMRSFVRVNQPDHSFAMGDIIRPDFANPGRFVKALADVNVASVIGVVSDVNTPSDNWFNFKPFGEIRENVKPDLIGNYGDFFYVDPVNAGLLTKVRPFNNARPVYMRLENSNRALLLSGADSQDKNETQRYDVVNPAGDQVNFTLPADAEEVLWMSINGIENNNFTFDPVSKGIVFDPTATGYGVDVTDEVFFIYKS